MVCCEIQEVHDVSALVLLTEILKSYATVTLEITVAVIKN